MPKNLVYNYRYYFSQSMTQVVKKVILTIYGNEKSRTETVFKGVNVLCISSKHCSIVSNHLSAQYNKLVVEGQVVMLNAVHNSNSGQNVTPVNSRSRIAVQRWQVDYHSLTLVD